MANSLEFPSLVLAGIVSIAAILMIDGHVKKGDAQLQLLAVLEAELVPNKYLREKVAKMRQDISSRLQATETI